ncbi:tRNA methyltransferase 10 homolog C [Diretmus argenteus]
MKDVPQLNTEQPAETEKIDLDIWKSVMRSKTSAEEKQADDEVEVEGEDATLRRGVLKDGSTLEATREMVMMWQQAGKQVPQQMTDEQVQTLAEYTTKTSKKKYLKFLAIKEGYKRDRKEKQQQKKAERAAWLEKTDGDAEEGDDQRAPIQNNNLNLRFWNRSLDKLLGWRSVQAMLFGQPLVFDMSYEQYMSRREVVNTVSQLMEVEAWNRRATEPFHLHFCNLQPDGLYMQDLIKRYGAEAWDRLLITATNRKHVEMFPREDLVYLTADSPNVLRTFDHSKIYIIGAFVDRSIQSGLSLAHAKRLKLATARLPLDEFLHWEIGAKNLTLDQMIRIMLTVQETGKWKEALQFVPTRKHDGFFSTRDMGVTHERRGASERSLRSGERNIERTFKSRDQSYPNKDTVLTGIIREKRDRTAGLTGDRGNKPAVTKQRTSLKSKLEERKSKSKIWWEEQ